MFSIRSLFLVYPAHEFNVERVRRAHPAHELGVVFERIVRVWVNEYAVTTLAVVKMSISGYARARTTVNGKPREQGANLVWGEDIDFEHGYWVWACAV
jgi:hypothetical protein